MSERVMQCYRILNKDFEAVASRRASDLSSRFHTATRVGRWIFICGGESLLGETPHSKVFRVRPGTWSIDPLPDLPFGPLVGHTAVAVGKMIYVFGGKRHGDFSNSMHAFDTEYHKWYSVKQLGDTPSPRAFHSAILVDDKIWVAFGRGPFSCFNDIFAFDVNTHTWEVKEYVFSTTPSPRCGQAVARFGNSLIFVGGYVEQMDAKTRSVENKPVPQLLFVKIRVDRSDARPCKLPSDMKKLLTSNAFFDCSVKTLQDTVGLHRIVLSVRSPYFKKLLEEDKPLTLGKTLLMRTSNQFSHVYEKSTQVLGVPLH